LFAGRVHYAWVIVAVMFVVIVASVGVRAAPSVLILPMGRDFGWSVATISGAVSLNIALFGLVGPFAAALLRTIGLKRTVLASMALLALGAGSSAFITQVWQLYLTWGVLVGIGSGAGMVGLAAAVANRWFVARRGLVVGLLTAGNASGQLVFLPILASLAQSVGWRSVPWTVALVILALMPVVMLFLAEEPASIGLVPFGGKPEAAQPLAPGNPVRIALEWLFRGFGSLDFWLLAGTFAVCGFSTYGLVATHLIPYCADRGIPPVQAASLLAAMGVFDLIGTTGAAVLVLWAARALFVGAAVQRVRSGQPGDLRGVLWAGLGGDGAADRALTTQVFGTRDAPVMVSWIVAAHQLGGAIAAVGAGTVRSLSGSYTLAFVGSGVACIIASVLVLRIARRPVLVAEAA
jgi:MFS family permease